MALVDDVACLASELLQDPGYIKTEITHFPSGAVSLLIRIVPRAFELVYLPTPGMFGVDELEAYTGFDSGYRFGFQDFASARAKLVEMVEEARAAAASEA